MVLKDQEVWWRTIARDHDIDVEINSLENRYADIDREKFFQFELMKGDNVLFGLAVQRGQGDRFVYRRRTRMTQGGSPEVQHLAGMSDTGYVTCYIESMGVIYRGKFGDEHHAADFGWPVSHTNEGEAEY